MSTTTIRETLRAKEGHHILPDRETALYCMRLHTETERGNVFDLFANISSNATLEHLRSTLVDAYNRGHYEHELIKDIKSYYFSEKEYHLLWISLEHISPSNWGKYAKWPLHVLPENRSPRGKLRTSQIDARD